MSNTILKDKSMETLHIRCDCGHFGIVEISKFIDEDEPFYFTITAETKSFKDKLKGVWRVLKGSPYGITDEVLFNRKDALKIIRWLTKQLNQP